MLILVGLLYGLTLYEYNSLLSLNKIISFMNGKKDINIAVLLIISGCLCGSLQKYFVKSYLKEIDVLVIVFYQYLFGFILYIPRIIKTKFQILATGKFFLITLRAALGVVFWFGTVLSLKYISLLDTVFLTSVTPLWVPILAYFFFSEKINKKVYFFIFIGLLGVAFILLPSKQLFSFGGMPALVSSLVWAISILLIAQLAKTEKIETILLYYFLIATLITAPFVIFKYVHLNTYQLAILFVNAILMVIHQELINKGYSYPKAYKIATLTYTNVIFSGLLGIFCLNETPELISIIGMMLVLYSCLHVTMKFSKNDL